MTARVSGRTAACVLLCAFPLHAAHAGSAPAAEQVEVTGAGAAGRDAMALLLSPIANYDDALRLTPSVLVVSPDGPGVAEAATVSIRGFTDGQYNVTFDGVPFADSDDFTHHSSACFVARDLGSVTAGRGPGDATTIGHATFGGSVALASRFFENAGSISPTVTRGSQQTMFGGVLLQSGRAALPGCSTSRATRATARSMAVRSAGARSSASCRSRSARAPR